MFSLLHLCFQFFHKNSYGCNQKKKKKKHCKKINHNSTRKRSDEENQVLRSLLQLWFPTGGKVRNT